MMNGAYKKRILVSILIMLSFVAALQCYKVITLQNQLTQSNEDYIEDFNSLVGTVEQTHPAFEIGSLTKDYQGQKNAILRQISVMTNPEDFSLLVSRYLTLLNDNHTRLLQPIIEDRYFLAIKPECHAKDGQLYLTHENNPQVTEKIISIGGISIENVYNTIDRYLPAENQTARDYNHNLFATNRELLRLSGCVIENHSSFGDEKISTKVAFSRVGDLAGEHVVREVPFSVQSLGSFKPSMDQISSKKLGDIYYIDMNLCFDNSKMGHEIEKLKAAIDSGIYKIIIDVRDNSGGNSEVCRKILSAMGMEIPIVGEYVRYSPLAHAANADYPITGSSTVEARINAAIPNSKIQLVVLMNVNTHSSALWLPVYVQDGKLGTIVGQPSINAPSHFGDILKYLLPNSKMDVSISHKYFSRPNPMANQKMLIPDYIPETGIDSLEFALTHLAGK